MISIVIPLYNKEKQIADTLKSVFAQTYQDFEVVIVNDGSTDGSVEAVQRIDDPRIRLISQTNAGVSAARNRGIAEARGEYIALLDADDEWKAEYLATQIQLAESYPECGVFVTNYEFRNKHGMVIPTRINNLPFQGECGILTNYFEVAATSHPPICSINIMASKETLLAVGGFPVGIKSGEDLLTWARLACRYKIAYSRKVLSVFKESASNGVAKPVSRLGGEKYIADNLIGLYESEHDVVRRCQLRGYIARWFKVWSVLLIETEKNHKAFSIAVSGLKWGGKLKHFLPIMFLSLMPSSLARRLFYKLRR